MLVYSPFPGLHDRCHFGPKQLLLRNNFVSKILRHPAPPWAIWHSEWGKLAQVAKVNVTFMKMVQVTRLLYFKKKN